VRVIAEDGARSLAEEIVASHSEPGELVITGSAEYDIGWVYFYDTRAYVESGDPMDGLVGNAPILIDRRDGTIVETGTGEPVETYVRRYEQRRAWQDAASAEDALFNDAVGLFAVVGPTMRVPVSDRLREAHADASEADLVHAERRARSLGERALELTRSAVADPLGDLSTEFPNLYPDVLAEAIHRAEYWWRWEI
jgi:Immunity protein 35